MAQESPSRESDTEGDPDAVVLRIDGLVAERLSLTRGDLERLPQHDFNDDLVCLEGWSVPDVKWGGVLLDAVLELAKPAPGARFVQASAGEFGLSLPMDRAGQVLLAIRMYDRALTGARGGPVRLVVPNGDCFMQIKWLDHLELRAEPGANTAERIALGRIAAGNEPPPDKSSNLRK
jgi:DMSO/TMAO reductase YedYZ molybdopterin-dependent catalytic subunit